jgi:HPt (histidine-containing phosphotransfer) domain-containing protein
MTTPINWERALENADGSEELLIELAGVFIAECPEMMRQIRAAIDDGNVQELRRTAHSFKGAARLFAAAAATEAAFALETMGANGDLSGADNDWAALRLEAARLTAALAERVGQKNAEDEKGAQCS